MPKIADIQETPNPNAVKFILKEPVSHGTSHSFKNAEAAADDSLARSLFEVGDVASVFYMDKMITVEKTDDIDWDEILPTEKVRSLAEDLPDSHGLRAADAAQLAAALVWCRERPKQRPMVCFDERLRTAAAALGFSVRP